MLRWGRRNHNYLSGVTPIPEGWSWCKALVRVFIVYLRAQKVPPEMVPTIERSLCTNVRPWNVIPEWDDQVLTGEPKPLWLFGQEDKLLSGHCPFLPTPPSKKLSDVRMEMAPLLFARSGCMQERNARHQQPERHFLLSRSKPLVHSPVDSYIKFCSLPNTMA